MRRLLFILTLLATIQCATYAQEVYNLVLESATRVVNNPTSGIMQTHIAQFKRTALVYMKSKAFETQETVQADFLNTQAYYLSEFLSRFFNQVIADQNASEDIRKDHIHTYMQASLANPLFGDTDTETVHAYVNDPEEITPFSIDTDWERANAFITSQFGK